MARSEERRPVSALEGTWPLDEWPVDVQRVDENGFDLSLIEYTLAQSPAERLAQLEEFRRDDPVYPGRRVVRFKEFLKRLTDHEVEFFVIGGVAAVLLGFPLPRLTLSARLRH